MADVSAVQAAWIAAGAALSGAGLTVLGSYLTGRVAVRTVKLQIDAAARQREEDRRLEIAGVQREARVAAHESALSALTELWRQVYDFAYERQWLSDDMRSHEIAESTRSEAAAAVARVAFVASEPVANACLEAHAAVLDVERQAETTFLSAEGPSPQLSFSQVRGLLEHLAGEVEARNKAYRGAARREIGAY